MMMSRDEGIRKVYDGPSHVVILGAGASIASNLHKPEASGATLPSMADLVEVVGLGDLVPAELRAADGEFEGVYSRLYDADPGSQSLREIEERIAAYFGDLRLPSTPTIYDLLMMSLRPKDLIATFNWDPFLFQAFNRNHRAGGLPNLSFLHGNVAIGYSIAAQKAGPAGAFADPACTMQFVPTRLLYPVEKKDYNADEFVAREWDRLRWWLQNAKRLTIFGYSAPTTDVEAMDLLSEAWGDAGMRNLEQVEIIDVEPEDVLRGRWDRFVHTDHYDCPSDYFASSLGQFPRRTGERFMHQYLPSTVDEAFQEPNPVPRRFDSLEDMWAWHAPLVESERAHESARGEDSD